MMNITTLYSLLAPIYDPLRPLWVTWLTGEVERCLEWEILPRTLPPDATMLDLGCGTGVNLARLRRLGLYCRRYIGLDLTAAMLRRHAGRRCDERARLVYGNAYRLPFATGTFDFVLTTWMMSHILTPRWVIDEALRVLRPGAYLAVVGYAWPPGLARLPLALVERTLRMRCLRPAEVSAWPGLMDLRLFAGGANALVLLKSPGSNLN
jgi:ubiquinone/menaquinone biosynthesis C-methylase UbiE